MWRDLIPRMYARMLRSFGCRPRKTWGRPAASHSDQSVIVVRSDIGAPFPPSVDGVQFVAYLCDGIGHKQPCMAGVGRGLNVPACSQNASDAIRINPKHVRNHANSDEFWGSQ